MPRKEYVKTIYNCEYCLKDISKNNKSRHEKLCKPKFQTQDQRDAIIDQRKRSSKGVNFFITFNNRFVKYKIAKRMWKFIGRRGDVQGYVIANETGVSYLPSPHSHMYIKMKEKMNFNEFKVWWEIHKFPMYQDIVSQKCQNMCQIHHERRLPCMYRWHRQRLRPSHDQSICMFTEMEKTRLHLIPILWHGVGRQEEI